MKTLKKSENKSGETALVSKKKVGCEEVKQILAKSKPRVVWRNPCDLKKSPHNARIPKDKKSEYRGYNKGLFEREEGLLMESIKTMGIVQLPIIDENNLVIDGWHRVVEACKNNNGQIPCILYEGLEDTPLVKKLVSIALNNIHLPLTPGEIGIVVQELREKHKLSYRDIERLTGIPKSTAHYYVENLYIPVEKYEAPHVPEETPKRQTVQTGTPKAKQKVKMWTTSLEVPESLWLKYKEHCKRLNKDPQKFLVKLIRTFVKRSL